MPPSTPNLYDDLSQNPIPQPQQTTYMPRTAQPRYESREPYREYPKSIPQYGEDEEKKPSRSSSVIKKSPIVLAIFFALSVVVLPSCRVCSTSEGARRPIPLPSKPSPPRLAPSI